MQLTQLGIKKLPSYATSFVGRECEIAQVTNLLLTTDCRLVTLVGQGGIGKTRLAIEVVKRLNKNNDNLQYPSGIYFVPLQSVIDLDNIIPTIAHVIGFEFYNGNNPTEQLLHYLISKSLLLILDNFEHLIDAHELIEEMLDETSQVKLLVTSRESLNLREEWLFHVQGMDYPEQLYDESLANYDSVNLFVELARRRYHNFSLDEEYKHVIRICQLVDGMPLALELATTWLPQLPCAEIVKEIQQGLDIMETNMKGIPLRHGSIRIVFDHSWQLLNPMEQRVFAGLSVFRGGFRREAAEQVVDASLKTLSKLVNKSFLKINRDGRYQIHELQRQYGEEKLQELPEYEMLVRERHCDYYCEFMNQPLLNILGRNSKKTLKAIDEEIHNFGVAWNWAIEFKRVANLKKAMDYIYWYSWFHSWREQGEKAFRQAIETLRTIEQDRERDIALGHALRNLAEICIWMPTKHSALEYAQESVRILRRLDARRELALAVGTLGWFFHIQRDLEKAKPLIEEAIALAEETRQYFSQASMFTVMGTIARFEGNYIESENWHKQALVLGQRTGNQQQISDSLIALGVRARMRGKYLQSLQHFEESLGISREHEHKQANIQALRELGIGCELVGNRRKAYSYLEESLIIARDWGIPSNIARSLAALASIETTQGRYEQALEHFQEAHDFVPNLEETQWGLAKLANLSGQYAEAERLYIELLLNGHQTHRPFNISHALIGLGEVALAQDDDIQAQLYLEESLEISIKLGLPPLILDTMIVAAELFLKQKKLTDSLRLAILISQHSASSAATKSRVELLLSQLKSEALANDLLIAHYETTSDDLLSTAQEILKQLDTSSEQELIEPLTKRELEVLRLVARGKSNRQIARELTLALGTVKSHLHNIIQKLDASNRTEAVTIARNLRLL